MTIDAALRMRALELVGSGRSCGQAARRIGVHPVTVGRWAKVAGMDVSHPGLDADYLDSNGRLAWPGRVLIGIRLREHRSHSQIARELGVHRSTVKREIEAGTADGHYRSREAQRRADRARRRPKTAKLVPGSPLWEQVVAWLDDKFSPEQIAGRLPIDFPDRDDMRVSHETIYQALYVQGAGSLRHELTVEKAIRSGRTSRKPRSKLPTKPARSWIGKATITARPAEVDDRAVPGHWEGDLIIGTELRSALITLFERTTRFVLIGRLNFHDSQTVTDRLAQMAARLPSSLWRSLTWDQGCEMANHARFTTATDCPVFFCDPHSPWQRPTNENGNGLIRDFFPKATDFTQITDSAVAEAERLLNTRPRKVLAFATPAEKLDQLLNVATTA